MNILVDGVGRSGEVAVIVYLVKLSIEGYFGGDWEEDDLYSHDVILGIYSDPESALKAANEVVVNANWRSYGNPIGYELPFTSTTILKSTGHSIIFGEIIPFVIGEAMPIKATPIREENRL